MPSVLGALVPKAAAWTVDSRQRERHSGDAAFLARLITDPLATRFAFRLSGRRRLLRLDEALGDPEAAGWRRLGKHADDASAGWRLLRT
ncbi:hypothetical protein [Geodermatophilus sp. SYSU D00710]